MAGWPPNHMPVGSRQCVYASLNPVPHAPCPVDSRGWNLCYDEPTGRPPTGRPNHDAYTICDPCWEYLMNDPPAGRGFRLTARGVLEGMIYQQIPPVAPSILPTYRLDNTSTIRNIPYQLRFTQNYLCTYCEEDEILQWRLCEEVPGYTPTHVSTISLNRHHNTCICFKRFMENQWYCNVCNRDALDERQMTATRNMNWLRRIGRTQAGHRRYALPTITGLRGTTYADVPCRCGRDVVHKPNPRVTSCLTCNGVKIWAQNIDTRYPLRSTQARRQLANLATNYPLEYGPFLEQTNNIIPDGAPRIAHNSNRA